MKTGSVAHSSLRVESLRQSAKEKYKHLHQNCDGSLYRPGRLKHYCQLQPGPGLQRLYQPISKEARAVESLIDLLRVRKNGLAG